MSAYLYVTHSDVCIGNSRPTLIVLHDKNRLSDLQSMSDTFFDGSVQSNACTFCVGVAPSSTLML